MSNDITIHRGTALIADGVTALVDGCPLAGCRHALDVVALVRAATVSVFDRRTKQVSLSLRVSRQFSSGARAIDHAMRAPQVASGKADLVITFDDGTDEHVWTLADAGWEEVSSDSSSGVRTVTSYRITGGVFTYSGPLAGDYDDALSDPPEDFLDGGAVAAGWITDGGAPSTASFAEAYDGGTP